MTDSISPLANATFRKLFTAQVIALAGTGLATVGLALLAYDLAGGDAGMVLGTALAIKMLAYVFIALVAGAYAQSIPRRTLLIALDVSRAVIVCFLPFVTEVWQVYVLIFCLNACSAAFTPTFQATIPDILPDDSAYTRALSLSRLAYDLENLISPTLAAIALAFVSYNVLFVANSLTFLVSALLVMFCILPVASVQEREESVWLNTTRGIRAYLATPRLRGLLAFSMAVSCAGAMVIVNTVVYVRDYLGGTDSNTAQVLACYGLGSMLVALSLPKFLDRYPDRPVMIAGSLLLSASLAAGTSMPGYPGVLIIWFALGAGTSMILTPSGRLLKRSSSNENRAAIYAAQFALSHACWLIAYPLAGWAGGLLGLGSTFAVLATVTVIAGTLAAWLWGGEDGRERWHTHEPMSHEHWHTHDEHHQHDHEGWEGPEPHRHPHAHAPVTHEHDFVIDRHHHRWPEVG